MQTTHPIFVHFPIALLTLYVGIEFFSVIIKKRKNNITILYIKLLLLVTGAIGSSIASLTGEGAEHQMGRTFLIERHSLFANIATNIFWVLAVIYTLKWFLVEGKWYARLASKVPANMQALIAKVIGLLEKAYIPFILSLAGLFAVTITGALGGAIVHGPDVDPMVRWSVDTFGSGTLPARSLPSNNAE
jgi:uncharacterized membrane protein